MKRQLRSLAIRLIGLIPLPVLAGGVRRVLALRLNGIDPPIALRFLLDLDNFIYQQTGAWAVQYDGGHHAKHRLTGYVEHFAELASRCPGPYLDIGCGDGELSRAIARRVDTPVVGIDISAARIRTARAGQALPNLSFLEGDATGDTPAGEFSTLILSNVLEHVARRPDFLKRLARAYAPRRVLIRVPMYERDWRVPLKRELNLEWRLDATHETEYTLAEFAAEMDEAGLVVLQQEVRWGEIWTVARPAS